MMINEFNKPISKRFIDAFPKFKAGADDTDKFFLETWNESPFYDKYITEDELLDIYNHLLAAYYNWHFIYLDDLGIKLNVMHLIHDYYPNTKERLSLANQLKDLSIKEFEKSDIFIDSSAQNPKITKKMDELVDLVDSQNASFKVKSLEQSLKAKFFALYDGIMDEFTERFRPLFVKLYNGVNDYVYDNEIKEE